jgi:hypothetical protein
MSVGCKGKGQTEEAASAQKCFGVLHIFLVRLFFSFSTAWKERLLLRWFGTPPNTTLIRRALLHLVDPVPSLDLTIFNHH